MEAAPDVARRYHLGGINLRRIETLPYRPAALKFHQPPSRTRGRRSPAFFLAKTRARLPRCLAAPRDLPDRAGRSTSAACCAVAAIRPAWTWNPGASFRQGGEERIKSMTKRHFTEEPPAADGAGVIMRRPTLRKTRAWDDVIRVQHLCR